MRDDDSPEFITAVDVFRKAGRAIRADDTPRPSTAEESRLQGAPSFMAVLETVLKVIIALILILAVVAISLVTVDQFLYSFTS